MQHKMWREEKKSACVCVGEAREQQREEESGKTRERVGREGAVPEKCSREWNALQNLFMAHSAEGGCWRDREANQRGRQIHYEREKHEVQMQCERREVRREKRYPDHL